MGGGGGVGCMYTDWPPGVATVDTVSSVVFQCLLFTTFLLLLIRGHSVSIIDQMQIASTLDSGYINTPRRTD